MNKIIRRASFLSLGLVAAMALTSCHSGSEGDNAESKDVVLNDAVKNSLHGVILDQDGAVLTGATVTINGRNVAVSGNTFQYNNLSDGKYTVIIKKSGYKDASGDIALAVTSQTVDGKSVRVGQNEEVVFYLTKEEQKVLQLTSSQSETITLETSRQDDGTGNIVGNTQDPSNPALNSEITATVEIPALVGEQITEVENQLTQQGLDLSSFNFTFTNMASLSDDYDEARATRAVIVPGDALPGNYTYFTGLELLAPGYVDFSFIPGYSIDVIIDVPDNDVKKAMKVYRKVGNTNNYTEITSATTGNGIVAIDNSKDKKVVVKINVLQSQSYAIGFQVNMETNGAQVEPITCAPVTNNGSSVMRVNQMSYQIKSGLVLTNLVQASLTDFLRKMVLRYYRIQAVSAPQLVNVTYVLSPAYSLPASGTLYLAGFQQIYQETFSIVNGNSAFRSDRYGAAYVYPYATIPADAPTPTPIHNGGSND